MDVGYLFMAAPAKRSRCSLITLGVGYFLSPAAPELGHGVAPLGHSWAVAAAAPDNHDGVITQLEPDILECEVKWALGSINTNILVEVMEFQLSYFKS